jgi:hypothetical protein
MATQEDIIKALIQLDSGNDEHWTDDGLPRVDIVQKLLKDPDVRRKDINDAKPGFSRAVPGQTTEPEDVLPGEPETFEPTAEAEKDDTSFLDDNELDQEELQALMRKRCTQAEERLAKARAAVIDAQSYVRKCEQWEAQAKQALHRRFPPMHENDAIKAHLEAQLRQRYERAGYGPSEIDAMRASAKKQRVPAPRVPARA